MLKFSLINYLIICYIFLVACNTTVQNDVISNLDNQKFQKFIDSTSILENLNQRIAIFQLELKTQEALKQPLYRNQTVLLNLISHNYNLLGDCQKALQYAFNAVEIAKQIEIKENKEKSNLENCYYNLASAYRSCNDFDNYKKTLDLCQKYLPKNDFELQGIIFQDYADYFINNELWDSVKIYSNNAINAYSKANNQFCVAEASINLANYYHFINQQDTAIHILNKSMVTLENMNQVFPDEYSLLARCYIKKRDYKRALMYIKKAEALANIQVDNNGKLEALLAYKMFYTNLKQKNNLLVVSDSIINLQRLIYDNELLNKTKQLEEGFIVNQKNSEISELNLKNKLSQQKIQIRNILLLALFVITMVVIAFLFQYFKSKKIKEENVRINLEQKLFAAQINPHFMFNALSAIQAEVVSNNPKKANLYLTTFGQLLQNILQSTVQEYIPINNEYKNWINYLELQKLRFKNFDYSINAYPNIDTDENQIAPMLVQPLIENAIEHGVKNTDERGILQLTILKNENNLQIEILDNGNGIQQMINENKISISTQLIEKRLQFLSKEFNTNAYLEIKNRTDANGVKAIIVLPIKTT